MKYQCIEIKQTTKGEVAYILNTETGQVTKSYVSETFSEEDPLVRPSRRLPVYHEDPANDSEERPKVKIADKPAVMPPGLRGVFLPPDTPGSAVETRVA